MTALAEQTTENPAPETIAQPAPKKAAAPVVEKTRPLRKLLGGKLKRAEHERMVYRVKDLDEGTEVQDIMKPEFWCHVGRVLRPFDLIEVLMDNGGRYVELVVMDAGPLWAKVAIKTDINLAGEKLAAAETRAENEENAPYKAEWKGGAKWCVIRQSDGEIIERGLSSKDEANKYIEQYNKVLGN